MAKQFTALNDAHRDFIAEQAIFFTGSCAPGARVNISPRSTGHLRVLDSNLVAFLDLTGSGSETAAHALADGPVTIMVCAFSGAPMILRLYGKARSWVRGSAEYREFLGRFYPAGEPAGARQILLLDIDLVQTSCGFAVPLFDHVGERDILDRWAERTGEEGLIRYREEKNAASIDGLPTGLAGA